MSTAVSGDFTVVPAPQRSAEWFTARLGRVTGSCAAAMMANGRGKGVESVQRRDLRLRLALERITGQSQDEDYQSRHMLHGVETEPEAFAAYEALTGDIVQRSGFLSHNALMAGCSLDGHIGDFSGILEIKCPKSATHYQYIRDGVLPADYRWQVIHNLFITNASYCDFVSYDRGFPPELQVFRVRVALEDFDIPAYHLALRLFLSEVEKEVESVLNLAKAVA